MSHNEDPAYSKIVPKNLLKTVKRVKLGDTERNSYGRQNMPASDLSSYQDSARDNHTINPLRRKCDQTFAATPLGPLLEVEGANRFYEALAYGSKITNPRGATYQVEIPRLTEMPLDAATKLMIDALKEAGVTGHKVKGQSAVTFQADADQAQTMTALLDAQKALHAAQRSATTISTP